MPGEIIAEIGKGVAAVDRDIWDGLNNGNPFTSHDFLSALEQSGSVGEGTGWQAVPISVRDDTGALSGAMPAYLKMHSQGEYIFDHHWADAYERAGGCYYPKLQIASPFSPVPGPRLLLRDPSQAAPLLAAAEEVVAQNGLSSAHATFVEEGQLDLFRAAGWLIRTGSQFHWQNRGYGCFDDFLSALASRKRKAVRKERRGAQDAVRIERLSGDQIRREHWDAFWLFYQDTGMRKWGQPYLTRAFFDLIGQMMADKLLLILAYRDDRPVAGALNMIGPDCLYGRYWGCSEDIEFLHFELCYYQAIEFAIEQGLSRVEAGAQGEHKLARGYEPVPTYSAHYIPNEGFRSAIADFLRREEQAMVREMAFLGEMMPFKRG
ncbi:GNAT family N-acetyltransferase [Sphingorhabdus arenilitoris]|uniref:GNAT family N-acetyltransferase n=1 Tax=Sphingorhabdus arenilitoris TaxID=1490041 RepID=A0ABV8RKP6_9SPHN